MPASRTPGRRTSDHVNQKALWALIIGVLFQGGFSLFAWKLVTIFEHQISLERESVERQQTAFRLQQAQQHHETIETLRELSVSFREVAAQARESVEAVRREKEAYGKYRGRK